MITFDDSGGTLTVVRDGETGFVTAPEPAALADAIDRARRGPRDAARIGENGRAHVETLGISWDRVVEELLR